MAWPSQWVYKALGCFFWSNVCAPALSPWSPVVPLPPQITRWLTKLFQGLHDDLFYISCSDFSQVLQMIQTLILNVNIVINKMKTWGNALCRGGHFPFQDLPDSISSLTFRNISISKLNSWKELQKKIKQKVLCFLLSKWSLTVSTTPLPTKGSWHVPLLIPGKMVHFSWLS